MSVSTRSGIEGVRFYIDCATKGDSPETCARLARQAVIAEVRAVFNAADEAAWHLDDVDRYAAILNAIEREFGGATVPTVEQ